MKSGLSFPSFYRPQTKFAKVMFLHLSVILFTRGVYIPVCNGSDTRQEDRPPPSSQEETRKTPQEDPPPGRRLPRERNQEDPPGRQTSLPGRQIPPEQCMLGDIGNRWVVRILLECILVTTCNEVGARLCFHRHV